jgi:hypothetical protein
MNRPPTLSTTPAPAQRERVLAVRVDWSTFDALKVAARQQGTTVSELVRVRLSGK